jgi:hypothetical protein
MMATHSPPDLTVAESMPKRACDVAEVENGVTALHGQHTGREVVHDRAAR